MASTGSSLEAEIAGIIPAIKPITAETAVPMNIFQGERMNSNSPVNWEAPIDANQTRNNPINPPITESITASKRNWNRMNLFFAPSDF